MSWQAGVVTLAGILPYGQSTAPGRAMKEVRGDDNRSPAGTALHARPGPAYIRQVAMLEGRRQGLAFGSDTTL